MQITEVYSLSGLSPALNTKISTVIDTENYMSFTVGDLSFPSQISTTIDQRLAARALLEPEKFVSVLDDEGKPAVSLRPYSPGDEKDFLRVLNNTDVLNKEFDIVSSLIVNSQNFLTRNLPKAELSTNIIDSKIFSLFPPLLGKLLYEGLGQNKFHKWHLMDHTRHVLLFSHKLIDNDKEDKLLNQIKKASPYFKELINFLKFSSEEKENTLIAGFFHDFGKNTSHFHAKAEGKGKLVLMDSYDYLKYFLDRVNFPDSRKNTICQPLELGSQLM